MNLASANPEPLISIVTGTNPQHFRPQGIKAPHGSRVFEISWPNGTVHRLPHSILRGFCPCAACQGHTGDIEFQGQRNLELRDIRQVGNYAVGLVWGDHHDSGIYSFEYLHHLGSLIDELGEDGLIARKSLPRGRLVTAASETD